MLQNPGGATLLTHCALTSKPAYYGVDERDATTVVDATDMRLRRPCDTACNIVRVRVHSILTATVT